VIKNTLAGILATPAIPEMAARAHKNLETAMVRASDYKPLRDSLAHLPRSRKSDIATIAPGLEIKPGDKISVTYMINNKEMKAEGTLVNAGPEWVVIQTPEGKRSIRMQSIVDALVK
jgi:hypothetical protein